MTSIGSPILNFDMTGLSPGPFYRGFKQIKSFSGVFSTVLCTVILGYFTATEFSLVMN